MILGVRFRGLLLFLGSGAVAVKKEFLSRKPVSWYSLTSIGQQALKAHVAAIESVIRGVGQ